MIFVFICGVILRDSVVCLGGLLFGAIGCPVCCVDYVSVYYLVVRS